MRFFFRSKQFKTIVAVFLIIAVLTLSFALIGTRMSPQTDIAGTIAAPIRSAAQSVSNAVSDFFKAYSDGNILSLENAEMKAQISELQNKVADYEEVLSENSFYKQYLEIKENNPDFKFADANIIAKDPDDPYGGFTLNKGSASDISLYDPVITDAGVVGYVTEVGLTSCKVTTILSHNITLGAIDNRTSDSGIVTGSLSLSQNGLCRFANLSRSCSVAVGDYVITSGEGIFPEGLLIGSVKNIGIDEYNTSVFAEIKPFVEFSEIRSVMVITSFEGQGGITVGNKE